MYKLILCLLFSAVVGTAYGSEENKSEEQPKDLPIAWAALYSEEQDRLAELEMTAAHHNIKLICYNDKPKLTRTDQCMVAIVRDALKKTPPNSTLIYFDAAHCRFNDESWKPILNKMRARKADLLVDADESKDISSARDGLFLANNNENIRTFFSEFFDEINMPLSPDKKYMNSFDQNLHSSKATGLELHSLEWDYPAPFIWGKWEPASSKGTSLSVIPISVSNILSARADEGLKPEGYTWIEDFSEDGVLVSAAWEVDDD